ncbi:MAG TPA: hypothetical protein VK672_07715 [Solirubrobacteraceae bacterium]|jgi:hypothetical protein|nr:hypothetical protein [Solirubrobacteraceae bacterium]
MGDRQKRHTENGCLRADDHAQIDGSGVAENPTEFSNFRPLALDTEGMCIVPFPVACGRRP